MPMAKVYLALGSNVGDSRAHIRQAQQLLAAELGNLKAAPLYSSKAVGYTDQPDFLNTAVSATTKLEPPILLKHIKAIEQKVGRTASFHWGPREIDIDIIFYDDFILKTEDLTIPHPAFAERDFVLKPLTDLNPSLIDPISGQTITVLLNKLSPGEKSILRKVD
jgi:2-amino-4-hydroxy-6-hydroxymethyldihydropteridine diphosphokinase